jgi:hypothetical protein
MNTTIATVDGVFHVKTVSVEEVKDLLSDRTVERLSAIGHESTAQVMSTLLSEEIAPNRIQYAQKIDDIAICLKIKGRIPEGTILDAAGIEAIGFELKLMVMVMNPISGRE